MEFGLELGAFVLLAALAAGTGFWFFKRKNAVPAEIKVELSARMNLENGSPSAPAENLASERWPVASQTLAQALALSLIHI